MHNINLVSWIRFLISDKDTSNFDTLLVYSLTSYESCAVYQNYLQIPQIAKVGQISFFNEKKIHFYNDSIGYRC